MYYNKIRSPLLLYLRSDLVYRVPAGFIYCRYLLEYDLTVADTFFLKRIKLRLLLCLKCRNDHTMLSYFERNLEKNLTNLKNMYTLM